MRPGDPVLVTTTTRSGGSIEHGKVVSHRLAGVVVDGYGFAEDMIQVRHGTGESTVWYPADMVRPLPPEQSESEEHRILARHLRASHPNLFGAGPDARFGFATPLPSSDLWQPGDLSLADLPLSYMVAVHDANHAGLYRQHLNDQWTDADG